MASVTYCIEELCSLSGVKMSAEKAREAIEALGMPVDEVTENGIIADITPNRIDLFGVEGMARAIASFVSGKANKYEVKKSDAKLIVDRSVKNVRPYIGAGIVKGVKINDALIRSLMQVQEKLHDTHGRGRRKVAIGIHNLDAVEPPFTYKAVEPRSISFVPLDMGEKLDLEQILERHPKGKEYAHIVREKKLYPVIVDKNENVLSFPPIINGELTRVDEKTKNLFLDVTGTSKEAVEIALNILACMLADRGGELYSVEVAGEIMPKLTGSEMTVACRDINKLLGTEIGESEMAKLLKRMGHSVEKKKNGAMKVLVPPYRSDVMHWVDLAEDAAIAYGYNNFEPTLPSLATIGEAKTNDPVAELMVGMGFQEAVNFTLTNPKSNFAKMNLDNKGGERMLNPLTQDFSMVRTWLLPSLLRNVFDNRNEKMPQRIFEIGECIEGGAGEGGRDEEGHDERENGGVQKRKLCAVITDSRAGFEQIKAVFEELKAELDLGAGLGEGAGTKVELRKTEHPSFINGRCAAIFVNGKEKGIMGEIHPQVLLNFSIEHPVVALEIGL
ncbi:MAG: phenylalanine--tRNA ligase subunit beta [Candidatus Micrarchaeota archaeon]|nr:phenylalanine--tRNA ligase subunit beta [Candidatus Micrarchaeota archaeon]